MRIVTKVWVGLGVIFGGYLVTLAASFYFGRGVEHRLAYATYTIFPASTSAQRALAALEEQQREYQDCVLFGELHRMAQGDAKGQQVDADLQAIARQLAEGGDDPAEIRSLADRHRGYCARADRIYPRLAKGEQAPSEAQALTGLYDGIKGDLVGIAHRFEGTLQREEEASVDGSRWQRRADVALFMVACAVSAVLFLGTVPAWTRRLASLASASSEMAAGDYDQPIADSRDDEVGVLTRSLDGMRASIQSRDRQLREINASLQDQVAQQTASLVTTNHALEEKVEQLSRTQAQLVEAQRQEAEAHRKLMIAARQAGMADIATGVLHNVGNVLNSVNVSANLVIERVERMRFGRVTQAAALLPAEPAALARFVAEDERARQLPAYLGKLGQALEEDGRGLRGELESLVKNIDHIRTIVAVQQSYAGTAGVSERLDLAELARDAAKLHANELAKRSIEVVEDFAELPPVDTDKHKLMQILVNLIGNAKHAVTAADPPAKRITLRLRAGDDGFAEVQVEDNGVGIAAENLNRVFQHGFTTKKNGHGFGLHSGALAARELGGTLTVRSDGPGKGAVFTVRLPMAKARAA